MIIVGAHSQSNVPAVGPIRAMTVLQDPETLPSLFSKADNGDGMVWLLAWRSSAGFCVDARLDWLLPIFWEVNCRNDRASFDNQPFDSVIDVSSEVCFDRLKHSSRIFWLARMIGAS